MSRYKKYENLPWYLNNLNHHTLTPTQKEVLDLDYYCKRFGTKLSHQAAAALLHRGRHTVYTARRRLEELGLRTTEPARGSFLIGHPVNYKNEDEFLAQLEAQSVSPKRFKMKRKSYSRRSPLRGLSSYKATETPAKNTPLLQQSTQGRDTPAKTGGSAWHERRNHPQWRKYLMWGFGRGFGNQEAEIEADYKFSKWLKQQPS